MSSNMVKYHQLEQDHGVYHVVFSPPTIPSFLRFGDGHSWASSSQEFCRIPVVIRLLGAPFAAPSFGWLRGPGKSFL